MSMQFNFIKQLISLRDKYSVFKDYDYKFLSNEILAFTKEKDNQKLLVVINNSPEQKTFHIPNKLKNSYLDLINNTVAIYDKITLDAYNFKLLIKEETN